jgi:ABC-type phosphate transport system substrate-binding protein
VNRSTSRLGTAARLAIVLVVALVVSFRSVPQARADSATPDPVEIDGSGSFDIADLMSAWGTPMFQSSSPVNLSYIGSGDHDGRTQLALGQVDFAVSAMPLTDEDNQRLAARNVSLIQAPLATTAMTFMYAPPNNSGLLWSAPLDPNADPTDPDTRVVNTPYTDPILRLPMTSLVKTMTGNSYNLVGDPDFDAQLGLPANGQMLLTNNDQWSIARSDPGAADFYMEQLALQYAPDFYNGRLTALQLPPNLVSESWPLLDVPTRSGSSAVADALATWSNPNVGGQQTGGTLGELDPSTAAKLLNLENLIRTDPADHPGQAIPLYLASIQNGAGEWVQPTPQSMTIAAAAGDGAPLYGLTQNVPGAYPFTFTTDMFVPSTGLSIDKTNAIATFLRYATGPGRALAAAVNDGQLPDALAAQAAEKADEIVTDNCKAAGGTTEKDPTGGVFWPTGVAVPSGGTLLCVAPAAPAVATTTTTAGSGTGAVSVNSSGLTTGFGATSFSSGSGGRGSSGGGRASLTTDPSPAGSTDSSDASTGEGGPASPTESGSVTTNPSAAVAPAAVVLPLRPPDDGQFEFDRFTTIILGGLFFLFVRSLVRPRLARAMA